MDPRNFEQHTLSRKAWMFKAQSNGVEKSKNDQYEAQRDQFDQKTSMDKMFGVLSATHLMVQRAEKLSRVSVSELDESIKSREAKRAAQLMAVQQAEIDELEKGKETDAEDPPSRWLRPRDDGDSMDEDDLEALNNATTPRIVQLAVSSPSLEHSARGPSPTGAIDSGSQSPSFGTELHMTVDSNDKVKMVHLPVSPLQQSLTTTAGTSMVQSPASGASPTAKARRKKRAPNAVTSTQGIQTNVFFAPNQHAQDQLDFITGIWEDVQKRMVDVEEYIYTKTAPHLSDMQSLLIWVRRTHRELQREFGTDFSLPPLPEIISAEAADIKERETDRELRFIRRVLQRNERSLMEAEEGDANLKYYRSYASTATQCKKASKGVACQTLISTDGIHQLVRQQHTVIEELLSAIKEQTNNTWGQDYQPNPETSFHTMSHLADMLSHDLQSIKDVLATVRSVSLEDAHDTKPPQRSVGCGPASDLKTMTRKTETDPVTVRPWAQTRESYVQAKPESVDMEVNTDMLRKSTMQRLKALNEADAMESSLNASKEVSQLEAKLKIALNDLTKAQQQNTQLTLRMNTDRLQELHQEEVTALQNTVDVETQKREEIESERDNLKNSLHELEEMLKEVEASAATEQKESKKKTTTLLKERDAAVNRVEELEKEQRRRDSMQESQRDAMERRMSVLDEKEQQLQQLARASREKGNGFGRDRVLKDQSTMAAPDYEEASTGMPKTFVYDIQTQCTPQMESRACDPLPLGAATTESQTMTDISGEVVNDGVSMELQRAKEEQELLHHELEKLQAQPEREMCSTMVQTASVLVLGENDRTTNDATIQAGSADGDTAETECQVIGLCCCNGQQMLVQELRKRYSAVNAVIDGGMSSPLMPPEELPDSEPSGVEGSTSERDDVGNEDDNDGTTLTMMEAELSQVVADSSENEQPGEKPATPQLDVSEPTASEDLLTEQETKDEQSSKTTLSDTAKETSDTATASNEAKMPAAVLEIEIADFTVQAGSATADLTQRFAQTYIPTSTASTSTGQTYRDFTMQARPPVVQVESCAMQATTDMVDAPIQATTPPIPQRNRTTQTSINSTNEQGIQCEPPEPTEPEPPLAQEALPTPPPCSEMMTQTVFSPEDTYVDEDGNEYKWMRVTSTSIASEQTEIELVASLIEAMRPTMHSIATQDTTHHEVVDTQTDWSSLMLCSVEVQTSNDGVPNLNLPLRTEQTPASYFSEETTEDGSRFAETPPQMSRLGPDLDVGPSSPEKFERLPTSDLERNIPSSFCEKREHMHSSYSNSASNTVGKLNMTMSNPAGLRSAQREVLESALSDTLDRVGTTGGFSVHEMYPDRLDTTDLVAHQQQMLSQESRRSSLPSSILKESPLSKPKPGKSPLKSLSKRDIKASKTPQPQLQDPSVLYGYESEKVSKNKSRYSADCFMKAKAKSAVKINSLAFSDNSVHDAMGSTLRGPAPPVVRGFANSAVKPRHAHDWQQRKPRFLEPLLPELNDAVDDEDDEVERDEEEDQEEPSSAFYYSPSRVDGK